MGNKTIVIPIYKEDISKNEMISLLQCLKILKNHSITLVAPQSLDIKAYIQIAENNNVILNVERFNDDYFADLRGYNNLMLNKKFYQRFIDFEYILIYQLDCFVFKDELDYWCQLKYDYIGSPFSHDPFLKGFPLLKKRFYNFKKRIRYKYKRNKHLKSYLFEDTVINGGFSLRKIKKMIEVIDLFEKNGKINRFREIADGYLQEDIFFAFEAKKKLKIPSYKFAANFSVEDFSLWYGSIENKSRSFGCHG